MELQEVRDTLFCLLTDIEAQISENWSWGDWQRKEALTYIVDKLDEELCKRDMR